MIAQCLARMERDREIKKRVIFPSVRSPHVISGCKTQSSSIHTSIHVYVIIRNQIFDYLWNDQTTPSPIIVRFYITFKKKKNKEMKKKIKLFKNEMNQYLN